MITTKKIRFNNEYIYVSKKKIVSNVDIRTITLSSSNYDVKASTQDVKIKCEKDMDDKLPADIVLTLTLCFLPASNASTWLNKRFKLGELKKKKIEEASAIID